MKTINKESFITNVVEVEWLCSCYKYEYNDPTIFLRKNM